MENDFGPPADQRYAGPHRPEPEVERDRFGRYMLPDPRDPSAGKFPWTRATTIASTIQDQYNLQRWQQRMVAHGIGKSESLYALAVSLDPVSDRGQLQQVCEDALAAAGANDGRNKGTALHGFWERVLRGGDPMTIPQAWRPHIDLAQIRTDQAGLIIPVRYIEAIVFCPDIETVGRTDCLVMSKTEDFAEYRVADLKTEKSEEGATDFSYSATQIAVQLAIYGHATHRWLPHERHWEELPVIDREIAYVLHLPSNAPASKPVFNIWTVDLQMGWEGALLAREVRAWRKRKNVMIPLGDVVPQASAQPKSSVADSFQALAKIFASARDADRAVEMANERDAAALVEAVAEEIAALDSRNPVRAAMATSLLSAADDAGVLDERDAAQAERAANDDMPDYVREAGGPIHYAAGMSQLMHDAILSADWDLVQAVADDPWCAGDDRDAARGALAGARRLESVMAERVRTAVSRDELSALWREWTGAGRAWGPELQEAGAARLLELGPRTYVGPQSEHGSSTSPAWLVSQANSRADLMKLWSNAEQTEGLAQAIKARLAEIEGPST